MSLATWVTRVIYWGSASNCCFPVFLSASGECAWSGILNTKNCKDECCCLCWCWWWWWKINPWPKAIKKIKQTSTVKNFFLISGNVGMTDWRKKYGDKGRNGTYSRTTSCLTVHKSYSHNYPYMRCFEIDYIVSVDSRCTQTDLHTPHMWPNIGKGPLSRKFRILSIRMRNLRRFKWYYCCINRLFRC